MFYKMTNLLLLIVMLFISSTTFADSSGCRSAAFGWIEKLEANHEILKSHAQSNCEFSGKWVHEYKGNSISSRKRLCNDLVLIWTHKKCIYFRDYVSPTAYDPCKSWTREMYSQCMDENDDWFP